MLNLYDSAHADGSAVLGQVAMQGVADKEFRSIFCEGASWSEWLGGCMGR